MTCCSKQIIELKFSRLSSLLCIVLFSSLRQIINDRCIFGSFNIAAEQMFIAFLNKRNALLGRDSSCITNLSFTVSLDAENVDVFVL